jgi:phage repressor protein C with HTH and peptisase S24 domain
MAIDSKAIGTAIRRRREELGWSQERLAEAAGASQTTVDRIEKGRFKRLPSDMPAIAQVLDLTDAAVRDVLRLTPATRAGALEEAWAGGAWAGGAWASGTRPPPEFVGERDLKVFAAAEAGPGEMVVSIDPIEVVPRPWYLREVKDAFAVLITGESMIPAFEPGDMAIVNRRLPLLRGKDVILVTDETQGDFRASIKRLMRWTEREWHLHQFNPPPGQRADFSLSRKAWPKAWRVVGKYYGG